MYEVKQLNLDLENNMFLLICCVIPAGKGEQSYVAAWAVVLLIYGKINCVNSTKSTETK